MKLVYVVWEDASAEGGTWSTLDAPPLEPAVFHQVGFLVSDTHSEIVLTAAHGPCGIAPRDRIPRGMIISVTEIDRGAFYRKDKKAAK